MADYVRALETKNKRLTELVSQFVPVGEKLPVADQPELRRPSLHSPWSSGEIEAQEETPTEDYLEAMIDGAGLLQQDRHGSYSYHGHYAGLKLLERVHAYCRQFVPALAKHQIFDQSVPWCRQFPLIQWFLPEKALAQNLVTVALNDACCLMTFVNKASFDQMVERIYSIDRDH
jgi:hypothetical protein